MKGDCWQRAARPPGIPPGRGEGRLALRWVGCARADPPRLLPLPPLPRRGFCYGHLPWLRPGFTDKQIP